MELLLGIDQGTSGLKVALFTLQGEVVGDITKEYPTHYPNSLEVEQNPEDWWNAVAVGLQELFEKTGTTGSDIIGIGVDGTSWACIPLNMSGNLLHPAIMWLDRRAEQEACWMENTLGKDNLWDISKNPADSSYITPKMLWLKNHRPEVFSKTTTFIQSNGYLVYRLTGVLSQDYSQGYGFHFFDMNQRTLRDDVAKEMGLSSSLVAPLRECHEVVGYVHKEAAKLTGLKEGTPVVAGGLDAACATLGAGVIHHGETQEQGGQAGGMSIVVDSPLGAKELILGCHVVPDRWLLQGGTTGGGGTLRWFYSEFGLGPNTPKGDSPFMALDLEAASVSPGSDGVIFLPYMKGERSPLWNSHAKGVFYGLSFDRGRKHMVRALMEGVGFSLQHNLEVAYSAGAQVHKLVSVGGAGQSKLWTQIKSDITGLPIDVPNASHATALGAAMLAGIGVGAFSSPEEARTCMVTMVRHHKANKDNKKVYNKTYEEYVRLSELLNREFFVSSSV